MVEEEKYKGYEDFNYTEFHKEGTEIHRVWSLRKLSTQSI